MLRLGTLLGFMLCSGALCQEPAQSKPQLASETDRQLYCQTIFFDGSADAKMKTVVSDFLGNLKKITGKDFKQADAIPSEGIILYNSKSENIPAEFAKRLEGKGKEAFLIHSEGTGRLWIIGNSDDAIRHGVYYYLEQLGCRWFFPNDNWTIIPSLKFIALQIDRVEVPSFRSRVFFGTGGFGGKLPVDPEMKLQSRWVKWMEENRFGCDIKFGGHMGEAFNIKYKTELEAHPEWLAEVNGKRQPWSDSVKWCVSNTDFQRFFLSDRLASFKKVYDAAPDVPQSMTISVEPADGAGYCNCEQCLKLGSDTDRIFTLANLTAKAIAERYPGRYVNLYAYGDHAGVPNIPVEPNVYVLAIPYGFQRTGLSGDDLLKAWAKKKENALGVYDYWAIPDWSSSLPSFSYLKDVPEKIRFWHQQHSDAFLGESTYSIGAMGIGWYLASKLMWNPDADEKAIFDDFYTKSFGPAAPPMKRMLERWANSFTLSGHELGLSYQDIVEARRLAKDPSTRARVDDYTKYIHYIRLWHEYQKSASGSAERKQRVRALLTYIWRIYDSSMAQTFRMHQLICSRFEAADKELNAEFPLKNLKSDVWTNLKAVSGEELDGFVADGIQTYKPFNFEGKEYSKGLIPFAAPTPFDGKLIESFAFVCNTDFQFWMSKDVSQIIISVRVNRGGQMGQVGDQVTVTDPDNSVIIQQIIPKDGEWHTLTVPNHGEGRYLMNVFDQKISFNVRVPANLPFVVVDGFMCPTLSTHAYFYVPKGLKKLALYCPSVTRIKLLDSNGTCVPYEGDNVIAADVPAGQDGKIWSFSQYKSWSALRPLNFPAAFSLTKQGLMIPAELKQ